MANNDAYGVIDGVLGSASKDASIAREEVQDLTERVKKIEDAIIKTEGRLSSIETDLEHLKQDNAEILSQLKVLTTKRDKQDGFFEGVKLTAKASSWVIGIIYGIAGGIIGFLMTKLNL